MKSTWIWLFALAAATVVLLAGTAIDTQTLVTICHTPPGDPASAHTITVGQNAVAAHQRHGDTLGPCAVSPSR